LGINVVNIRFKKCDEVFNIFIGGVPTYYDIKYLILALINTNNLIHQNKMGLCHRLFVAVLLLLLISVAAADRIFAQASNFNALYFQNRYLTDPAMAGFTKGLIANLGYQQQFNSVPGSPKLQYLTLDYSAGSNVGLGLNVNSSTIGLISSTRLTGTYAYHLPVGQESNLNLGLSLGFDDNYIDYSQIVGNTGDISVDRYNQRAVYVDGDFGVSYTSDRLTIQAAIPNLKSVFFKITAQNLQTDMSVFYGALSYKFFSNSNNNFSFEPLLAVRGIRGSSDVLDGGFNLDMVDFDFNFSAIYHTNKSATFGFGLNLDPVILSVAYTDSTAPIKTYSNNTFEIGLRIKFLSKANN
jgi:type IX secretion system PorP/SprF family membrane protein